MRILKKHLSYAPLLLFYRCSGAAVPAVAPHHALHERATGSLDSFIAAESPIALQGVLNNIGSGGSKAPGTSSGIVIASPSTTNPNCKPFHYPDVP